MYSMYEDVAYIQSSTYSTICISNLYITYIICHVNIIVLYGKRVLLNEIIVASAIGYHCCLNIFVRGNMISIVLYYHIVI